MITKIKLSGASDAQELISLASELSGDAYIHFTQADKLNMIDMKAFPDISAFDFSAPVLLVSENNWIHKKAGRFAATI